MSIEEAMHYSEQGYDVVRDGDKNVTRIEKDGKLVKEIKD